MSKKSIETYWEQVQSGNLINGRAKLYRFIRENEPITTKEMQMQLGWPMASVTGRLSELMDEGLVYETTGGKYCCITMEVMRAMHVNERRQIRYRKWLAVGQKHGWI
jgi:hypothetical protein